MIFLFFLLNQAHASQRPVHTWLLEIAFIREVSVSVCVHVCVCPKAINYTHVIFNLYNQLNKFVTFRNGMKQFFVWVAIVMKHVVTETDLIRLC